MSYVVKKVLCSAVLALTIGLIGPALASADAPDVTSATGRIVSSDQSGTVVEISGTWAWTTHHSNCNLDRAGVGIAVDWGDNNGNHVTTLNGDSIDVGVLTATLLNAQDNEVHNTSGGIDTGFTCGTFNGSYNTGTFTGLTHTYPAGSTIPQICALSYDVHGKNGIPSGDKETIAGGPNHNGDNSAEKNASTPGGNRCATIVLPNHPSVTTDAGSDVTVGSKLHDTATLSGGSADISGQIEFSLYGPNDADCSKGAIFTSTVQVTHGNGAYGSADSQVINTAGTYYWIANYKGDAKNDATANKCGAAGEDVVVGPGGPTVTTDAGLTVELGNAIHDTATLAKGSNPTGSITFSLYGPNNATCSGVPIFTSTVQVDHGNGVYESDEFTPTQAGTYRWIANYGGDNNNNATSNVCNAAKENVDVSPNPRIQLDKSGPGSALAGDNVQFTLDVSNPTTVPLHNVVVTDPKCDVTAPALDSKHGDGSANTLDQGDLWTYKCIGHTTAGSTKFENAAEACADPPAPAAKVCNPDTFDVPLRNPAISIDKVGPASITAGGTISYTLDVKNTGDQRFAEAKVVVTDPKCDATPTLDSKNGDNNTPAFLNPGETWRYVCSHATKSADTGTYHNVGFVQGTDEAGDIVGDDDPADTVINPPGCQVNCSPPCTVNCGPSNPNPRIAINKTGPATATAGDVIPYLLDVTNTGDQAFSEPNLALSDPLCGTTPTLSSKNGDQSPAKLNPGETWAYTCSVPTAAGQTNVHNVGSVCGVPDLGATVCDDDDADTVLAQQAVEPLLPGVSRLRGPSGCIAARSHVLSVTGSRIARVSFYLDGRYIGTRTKANRGSSYTLTIRGAKLRRGSHRVTARVTYQAGSNPQTKTLNLTFARCARAVTPKFTG